MKVLPWFWVGPTPLLGARLGELALAARGDPGFTTGVAAPKDTNGTTTGEYCVTWSSTTAIQTINVENEFTTDFNY